MKTFICYEDDPEDPAGGITLEYTEDDIIAEYWEFWVSQLKRVGREDLISRENCIEDWIAVNWALEKKEIS